MPYPALVWTGGVGMARFRDRLSNDLDEQHHELSSPTTSARRTPKASQYEALAPPLNNKALEMSKGIVDSLVDQHAFQKMPSLLVVPASACRDVQGNRQAPCHQRHDSELHAQCLRRLSRDKRGPGQSGARLPGERALPRPEPACRGWPESG